MEIFQVTLSLAFLLSSGLSLEPLIPNSQNDPQMWKREIHQILLFTDDAQLGNLGSWG